MIDILKNEWYDLFDKEIEQEMSLVMQAKPKLTLLVLVFIFIGGFKMLLRKNIKVEDYLHKIKFQCFSI